MQRLACPRECRRIVCCLCFRLGFRKSSLEALLHQKKTHLKTSKTRGDRTGCFCLVFVAPRFGWFHKKAGRKTTISGGTPTKSTPKGREPWLRSCKAHMFHFLYAGARGSKTRLALEDGDREAKGKRNHPFGVPVLFFYESTSPPSPNWRFSFEFPRKTMKKGYPQKRNHTHSSMLFKLGVSLYREKPTENYPDFEGTAKC